MFHITLHFITRKHDMQVYYFSLKNNILKFAHDYCVNFLIRFILKHDSFEI